MEIHLPAWLVELANLVGLVVYLLARGKLQGLAEKLSTSPEAERTRAEADRARGQRMGAVEDRLARLEGKLEAQGGAPRGQ